MRPAAQQLGAVESGELVVALGFEGRELLAIRGEVGAEGLDAVGGLVGFGGDELVLSEVGVGVDGAGEGGE